MSSEGDDPENADNAFLYSRMEAKNMTAQEKTTIMRLRKKGTGYSDIAKQLNLSLNSVKSFCRRNSLMGMRQSRGLSKTDRTNNLILCKTSGNHTGGEMVGSSDATASKEKCRLTISFAERSEGNLLADVLGLLMQDTFSRE